MKVQRKSVTEKVSAREKVNRQWEFPRQDSIWKLELVLSQWCLCECESQYFGTAANVLMVCKFPLINKVRKTLKNYVIKISVPSEAEKRKDFKIIQPDALCFNFKTISYTDFIFSRFHPFPSFLEINLKWNT